MHQCLKCKRLYDDDVVPILEGCECTSRMFLFVKQADDMERAEEIKDELETRIQSIEREKAAEAEGQTTLEDHTGEVRNEGESSTVETRVEPSMPKEHKPTIERRGFGIETIKVQDLGVYQINLDALMKGNPIIVLSKGGSYIISLPSVFGREEEIRLG